MRIAVIGSGISGLAAAWLLAKRHDVTLYEQARRPGGHSNTVSVRSGSSRVPVDTGFIVYNEAAYPNLSALFRHLGVETKPTDMTFSVSLRGGQLEYAGGNLSGLLAQPANIARPRFWQMLADIVRFYRRAPDLLAHHGGEQMTLGELLDKGGYGEAFRDDHLLPMAGAIWSARAEAMLDYPAAAFVRFFENHGLLKLAGRPLWRTVEGGSVRYVSRILDGFPGKLQIGVKAMRVERRPDHVLVHAKDCEPQRFDHAVVATHANDALALLSDADDAEHDLLAAFRYTRNRAVLHSDTTLMPRRRRAWASWNYLSSGRADTDAPSLCVTYWMNSLQGLIADRALLVTLNPGVEPAAALTYHEDIYHHPLFDTRALASQRSLWSLQGRRRTWFCGAYFGAGFHEDGLQVGLAVAEQLGGVRRPWQVAGESGRIFAGAPAPESALLETVP